MADNGTDIWLKRDGTNAQAKAALETLGLTQLMYKDEDGTLIFANVFNHNVALIFHTNLMTAFAIYDNTDPENPILVTPAVHEGPHLMIRLMSQASKQKARQVLFEADRDIDANLVRKTLPVGIAFAEKPTTIDWL